MACKHLKSNTRIKALKKYLGKVYETEYHLMKKKKKKTQKNLFLLRHEVW